MGGSGEDSGKALEPVSLCNSVQKLVRGGNNKDALVLVSYLWNLLLGAVCDSNQLAPSPPTEAFIHLSFLTPANLSFPEHLLPSQLHQSKLSSPILEPR